MTERDELHLLTGAYALNALGDAEKAEFEDYLEGSQDARTEVNQMLDTAAMLGLSTRAVVPSPELKANLMALLSSTPQHSATEATEIPVPSIAEQRSIRSIADGSAPVEPTAVYPEVGPVEARAHSRWFSRPLGILAAAAAAVALFAGGAALGQGLNPTGYQQAQADRFVAISTAADVQRSVSTVEGGGSATLLWSDELQQSAIRVDGLPPLAENKVYQLWYIGEAGVDGAGIFSSADGASTWRVLEGHMGSATAVGVTVEPQGGSDEPTTKPIMVIDEA
ncbi:MAG: anti-sigma factor [Burkholderiaceae bacterium]|nr:anti-sigma factor [Microbacteriaceae bacterium]